MKTRRLRLRTLMIWIVILGSDFSLWVHYDLGSPSFRSDSTWPRHVAMGYVIFSLIAMGVGIAWQGGWDKFWHTHRPPTREESLAMVRDSIRIAALSPQRED